MEDCEKEQVALLMVYEMHLQTGSRMAAVFGCQRSAVESLYNLVNSFAESDISTETKAELMLSSDVDLKAYERPS